MNEEKSSEDLIAIDFDVDCAKSFFTIVLDEIV